MTELEAANHLLEGRDRLLRAIPECPVHGWDCVPHAVEWVERAKRVMAETGACSAAATVADPIFASEWVFDVAQGRFRLWPAPADLPGRGRRPDGGRGPAPVAPADARPGSKRPIVADAVLGNEWVISTPGPGRTELDGYGRLPDGRPWAFRSRDRGTWTLKLGHAPLPNLMDIGSMTTFEVPGWEWSSVCDTPGEPFTVDFAKGMIADLIANRGPMEVKGG